MPRFYFHLADDQKLADTEGTEFPDTDTARDHAYIVAAELTANGSEGMLGRDWRKWTMMVTDDIGRKVLSFPMAGTSGPAKTNAPC